MPDSPTSANFVGFNLPSKAGLVSVKPTQSLKFIRRDGKLILQQLFEIEGSLGYKTEWRDVPLEGE